ncbi:MAG: aminomethyl-transferring glycine dehydrogenase subunit GcvPA [Candidatus Delongbacteria bacterium]|nr:aminomethyl-transferring glycine dehydrogenase subunit GcvPA [Candidatus Delongbacteria bacterium]
MPFIPNTEPVQHEMLKAIGRTSFEDLIQAIPEEFRLNRALNLPDPLSEYELEKTIRRQLKSSQSTQELICFAGGGSYDHFVPAIIPFLTSRSEFYTAYTPYQPEVSQGTLQVYFEFQSLICDLTHMEAANASMYDGASATAEAVLMAERLQPGKRIYIAGSLHPHIKQVIDTYNRGLKLDIRELPAPHGRLDADSFRGLSLADVSAIVVQSPNYYGILEEMDMIRAIAPSPILLIMNTDLISLGILKKPGDYQVDIMTSDGQSLGNNLNLGGPSCGVLATKMNYIRQMPGRIAGMTQDSEGRVGFVTTLQTREQHIRRSKATSNICTAQALNALATTIFLASLGQDGLQKMAHQSLQNSHYLMQKITAIPGFTLAYACPFFKEFLVETPIPAESIIREAIPHGLLAGIHPVDDSNPNHLLIAVTEKRNRHEMDQFIRFLSDLPQH